MKKLAVLLFFVSTFLYSCSQNTPEMEEEIFDDVDRPFFKYNDVDNYYYCEPWNYFKDQNSTRRYPLVVFLHASGGEGDIDFLNYLGYDTNDGNDDLVAKKFQKDHPCFVLLPQASTSWNKNDLIDLTEDFKQNNRIDLTRIYLIGYSMGGSGSYSFANAYFDKKNHLFAGIIRLAGQSETELRDGICENTSVWLHIGLEDTQKRIDITREAYDFLRAFHLNGKETSKDILVGDYSGTTLTITSNGVEVVKKTEYDNADHGIQSFPFEDNELTEWLFNQKL